MLDSQIKRGDIFYADLGEGLGSEQGGIRPVLIIQNNVGNRFSRTVIIVCVTSQKKKSMPTHVYVPRFGSLREDSTILGEQVFTLDKSRLKEYVGRIGKEVQRDVDRALAVSIGITFNTAAA